MGRGSAHMPRCLHPGHHAYPPAAATAHPPGGTWGIMMGFFPEKKDAAPQIWSCQVPGKERQLEAWPQWPEPALKGLKREPPPVNSSTPRPRASPPTPPPPRLPSRCSSPPACPHTPRCLHPRHRTCLPVARTPDPRPRTSPPTSLPLCLPSRCLPTCTPHLQGGKSLGERSLGRGTHFLLHLLGALL